ncbi:hypothetical protein BGX23_005662 [Mortierella sp. AD031]|nr:hypothetical protein BGX23_005662 [Mortierella sp. AD031]
MEKLPRQQLEEAKFDNVYHPLDNATCKTIRHLEPTIALPQVPQDPFYQRAPVVLSEKEEKEFEQLEQFNRQFRSLVILEYLALRAVYVGEQG